MRIEGDGLRREAVFYCAVTEATVQASTPRVKSASGCYNRTKRQILSLRFKFLDSIDSFKDFLTNYVRKIRKSMQERRFTSYS